MPSAWGRALGLGARAVGSLAGRSIDPRMSASQRSAKEEEGERKASGKDDRGGGAWLNAHYDPVASLYTFSSCIALEDLDGDGDYKLLVGDLGNGQHDMKLKVYKGTNLTFETPLLDLPTGVRTFYMDTTDPRTPAVAVASGSFVYVYKNLRPYFKFTLPSLELNLKEVELWQQAKEGKIDAATLREALEGIHSTGDGIPLTVRSLKFLQVDSDDLQPFLSVFKHMPLKRQSVITALSTLKKSHAEDDAVSCLVVATESKDIYVLDPEAFTVLAKMMLPAVPVFLNASGLFEVEYQIIVACRDACIYTIKSGSVTPKYKFPLGSQPCGLVKVEKSIVVGCMDNTLASFNLRGKRLWTIKLPEAISSMALMDYRPRGLRAVLVALRNREVRIYKDKILINTLVVDDIVVGLKFGRFGREDGALLMVTQGGALVVKILKRKVNLDQKETRPGPPAAQMVKLNVPKKTKVFVDQTVRERESAVMMHNTFQRDLYRLRLETSRAYVKAVTYSLAPISASRDSSLQVTAAVQGLGPIFRLTVSVQNTSPSTPATDHFVTFKSDPSLYRINKKFILLPLLVPSLTYDFETVVECLDDLGRTEPVSVYILRKGNPVPLITASINMPVSESVIVV